jgi:peptidoglycan/xylan/chitin deacetylase (PgdA/CDA1 family)
VTDGTAVAPGRATPRSHPLYRVLSGASVPRLARAVRGGAQIFCFHNVVPAEDVGAGDASLHMEAAHFADIVSWIASVYDVIPVDEVVRRLAAGRSLSGAAALTFDDAYTGLFHYGAPTLRRLGLPATVFVVAQAAKAPSLFWWDQLGINGLLEPERRRACLEQLGGAQDRILKAFPNRRSPEPDSESLLPLRWPDIRAEVEASGGLLSVGSHTARHLNLTLLRGPELSLELDGARAAIGAEFGAEPDVVSYPYGCWNEAVASAARGAGYVAGFTLETGAVKAGADPLSLPRLNVPGGIGVEALECWASGLRPRRAAW